MIIIAGFDCAIHNLGICYVEFNDEYKISLCAIIEQLKCVNELTLDEIIILLNDVEKIIDNIVKVIFFNVVDLVPGLAANKVHVLDRTRTLKYLLHCLDEQLPKPDIVLIEYQMKHNDISRCVSDQIAYHYTDIDCKIDTNLYVKNKSYTDNSSSINNITYAVNNYPINRINSSSSSSSSSSSKLKIVDIVGTGIKNSISFSEEGAYYNFIVRYSNKVSNKKHTSWNFKYFMEHFGNLDADFFIKLSKKYDDISDSFMMIFGWLKKNSYL